MFEFVLTLGYPFVVHCDCVPDKQMWRGRLLYTFSMVSLFQSGAHQQAENICELNNET